MAVVEDLVNIPEQTTAQAPAAKAEARPARQELTYVRSVRALAMIVIVTLHVAFPLIYLYNTISYGEWWISTNFYIWGKMGSPLFTMVSGLLLLNPGKDQPISVFFRKRFMKVLMPFLAWAVLYLFWRLLFHEQTLTGREVLDAFVKGPMYYHLWFIQMILGLYLATPILRIYTRHASHSNLTYFVAVWFISSSLMPVLTRFTGIEIGIDIVVTTQYVGFFVLGYYLRDVVIQRKHLLPLLAVIVASLVFTQFMTHALTVELGGTFDNFFVLNDSFNLIIVAVCLFLILKSLDYDLLFSRIPAIKKVVMWISSCSLGIYFVHVMILEILQSGRLGFELSAASFNPLLAIPLTSALVMALSIIVVALLQRLPVVRHIVP